MFPFTIKYKIRLDNQGEKINTEKLFEYITSYVKNNNGRVIEVTSNALTVGRNSWSTPGDIFRPINKGIFTFYDGTLTFEFSLGLIFIFAPFFILFFTCETLASPARHDVASWFFITVFMLGYLNVLTAAFWYKDMLKEISKGFKGSEKSKEI